MRKTTLLLPLLLAGAAAAQAPKVDFPGLVRAMSELEWLWTPPPAGERNIQFSSYDRGSDRGIGDQDGWWANGDVSKYLRVEERDGKKEYVMVDVGGPGAVVRIWSANPKGNLYFYLDGAAEPTWSVDFVRLTSGKLAPFVEPLAGMRARGANCHVPFPFARHLKITASTDGFYYQVGVRLFPAGTAVESFAPALLERHAGLLAETAGALAAPHGQARGGERHAWKGTLELGAEAGGVPMMEQDCLRLAGPIVVRALAVQLAPAEETDFRNLLRRILIVVEADGHETVRVPAGDFFGAAPDLKPYQSYPMGVVEAKAGEEPSPLFAGGGRWGYCYFPMPAREHLRIALAAEGPVANTLAEVRIVAERRELPADALAFRASWHLEKKVRTRPFRDHRVLDARGRGRFVGCGVVVANPTRAWWGEGDEKFFVDGESFPSTFGTGTEDYFGYAWCCPEPFMSAYHAQVQCDGPGNFGFTCVDRFQIPDMVPFHRSFLFEMEIWHWADVFMDYSSTAWWYGGAGVPSGTPDLPPFEMRRVDPIEPVKPFVAAGAVEGETMKVLEMTGGTWEVQEMGGYRERTWSRDAHLWWKQGKPGDRLVLELNVPEAGRYRVRAAFTKAPDYGIFQPWLAGRKLGGPIDLFHRRVAASGLLVLGEAELPAGAVPFALEIAGRNEKAVPNHMAGLDYIKLERL